MFKNPRSYILAGVIILLATWFWQFLKIEYYRSQEFYIATVELGIEEQLANVELEMIPVLDSVSTVDILEFSDYSFKTTYPFLIYRNGELKVWKDYHLAPTFTEINSEENVFLLRNSGGDFLVRKWHSDSRSGQYLIASLIPLTIEYKVQNSYLSDYFNESIFKDLEVQISNQEVAEYLPVKVRGESLLWIMVNSAEGLEKSPYLISLLTLYTIGIFLLIIGSAIWAIGTSDGRQWMLIVYIIAVWGILKLAVFLTGFPDSLVTIDLFDSKFFVVSWFEQSFGDMLLNTIAILLIGIILFRHYRQPFANLNLSGRAKLLLAVGLSFVLHLVINYQYLQLRTIYFNSQLSLDITSSFHFDSFRIYALIVFVIVGISSALLFHVVFKHLEALLKGTGQKVLTLLAGTLIFVLFTIPANLPLANLVLVTLTLSILLFASGIHRALQQ